MPGTTMEPRVFASDRRSWRAWLTKHHATETEAWLVYYKKHTGKPSIGYLDSVREALCFGWIDGLKRRIDDETYAHRFTPRKPRSKWSPQNMRLARELIEAGLMTKAGLSAFKQRVRYEEDVLERIQAGQIDLSAETENALKSNPRAWRNFEKLSPGYRKQYVAWIQTAKRPETRKKRLEEAIGLLEENRKLGMK
jgi:uncharacterized protein YdeI (YjbR/CyaY-like superfamily)